MADLSTGFDNGARLASVRTDFLNPTMKKVSEMEPKIDSLENDMAHAFNKIELVGGTKIKMSAPSASKEIDLSGIIPPPVDTGIDVEDTSGVTSPKIKTLKFKDADIVGSPNKAEVVYDFDRIVKNNQRDLVVKLGPDQPDIKSVKSINFTGDQSKVSFNNEILNFEIPTTTPPLRAKIGADDVHEIESINLIGDATGSMVEGKTLKLYLPKEGGTGPTSTNNFKGFFESLGDIESQITNPVSGKTYAFAKDSKLGGNYYTPYFYVNGGWSELKQDPALIYTSTGEPNPQGVFSITPDPRITIDNQGQLNLSNLGKEPNFMGFFNNQAELSAAVTSPIMDKSFAYIRHTNGAWIGKVYRHTTSGPDWQIVAPISCISLVTSPGSPDVPTPVYGFYKNGMIEIDSNGLATIKGKEEQTIKINVLDANGDVKTDDVLNLQFMDGESYVTLQNKTAYIQHPQRVMEYDSEFESDHNSNNYMGNLYYDKTSRTWMGWGIPDAPGGVDHKWTRVIHPKMSDEVKDLGKRLPRKAPDVTPGILGDSALWEYNGWTYVVKDDTQLPLDFRDRCGGYISTIIQDITNDLPRPQERLQICYADEAGGHCYVRRWNKGDGSPGSSNYGWFPWVKISMSAKDISDHNTDPGAHSLHNKFYKVGTFSMYYQQLKTKGYKIEDRDLALIADSHGTSLDGEQYVTIPYTGSFKFSGRITTDFWGTAAGVNTQWLVKVIKLKNNIETVIGEFAYSHNTTTNSKYAPPFKWATTGLSLDYGDKVIFHLQCLTDTTFQANYPELLFPMSRNYIVIEDARTTTGSRIAEMHRRTSGGVNSQVGTGVNVHYTNMTAMTGAVRMYSAIVNNTFADMNKIKG